MGGVNGQLEYPKEGFNPNATSKAEAFIIAFEQLNAAVDKLQSLTLEILGDQEPPTTQPEKPPILPMAKVIEVVPEGMRHMAARINDQVDELRRMLI
jgi:ribosomal protein L15